MTRERRLAAALLLSFAFLPLCGAVDDVVVGANGSGGASGQNAVANAVSTDPTNFASARGGMGSSPTGAGGSAQATAGTNYGGGNAASNARATAVGGDTGFSYPFQSYPGGDASATATGSSSTAASLDVLVNASGGAGSNGGVGAGGAGGNVAAAASGDLQSGGPLTVTVDALSGAGGDANSQASPGDGGSAGTLTFGTIAGTSLGDATVTLRARGGAGGSYSPNSGAMMFAGGADGRSVILNNAIGGSAGGLLRLVQEAVAGNPGLTRRGNRLPLAGEARSTLDRTAGPGTATLHLETKATGSAASFVAGVGGIILAPGVGGLGAAESRSRHDSGRALALATGLGGASLSGGDGGPASAIAHSTSQTAPSGLGASSIATATGRPGTTKDPGTGDTTTGGAGGRADATAQALTTGNGTTLATATATGGNVPAAAVTNAPLGGTAVATATGTASGAAALTVTATATGGQGAPSSSSNSSPGGPATATATGTTLGAATILARADGGFSGLKAPLGLATATGTAASGSVTADASTGRLLPAVVPTISARAVASGPPLNGARSVARAEMSAGSLAFDLPTAPQAFAAINATPTAAAVNAALSGNAGSAARFDTSQPVQLLHLSTAGGQAPAGTSGPVTLSCQLTCAARTNSLTAGERQNLLLALLNPRVTGRGLDALRLRVVREGVTIHDVTLSGPNAIRAYFTDHVLDLGPIPASVVGDLDVDLLLDLTASQPGAGFYATLFLGNAAPAAVQTVDQWRVQYFGPGATNSGPAADDANPAGDGLSNLLKYALGYNPLLAYPAGTGVVFDTDSGRLRLSVERNPATSNIALTVEGTDDLAPGSLWSSAGLTIEQNSSTLLRVSDPTDIAPGARRMLRLRVTRF
ncbi:MAG: hypothetical protein JSR82_16440 [Verrucomicrobia bacterium]|nr:hypothetical protein [Verrucomicrobiota bacterium]